MCDSVKSCLLVCLTFWFYNTKRDYKLMYVLNPFRSYASFYLLVTSLFFHKYWNVFSRKISAMLLESSAKSFPPRPQDSQRDYDSWPSHLTKVLYNWKVGSQRIFHSLLPVSKRTVIPSRRVFELKKMALGWISRSGKDPGRDRQGRADGVLTTM